MKKDLAPILNALGLLLTFIGAALLFVSSATENPALFETYLTEHNPQSEKKRKRYLNLARVGFALVAIGTLVQFIAIWVR